MARRAPLLVSPRYPGLCSELLHPGEPVRVLSEEWGAPRCAGGARRSSPWWRLREPEVAVSASRRWRLREPEVARRDALVAVARAGGGGGVNGGNRPIGGRCGARCRRFRHRWAPSGVDGRRSAGRMTEIPINSRREIHFADGVEELRGIHHCESGQIHSARPFRWRLVDLTSLSAVKSTFRSLVVGIVELTTPGDHLAAPSWGSIAPCAPRSCICTAFRVGGGHHRRNPRCWGTIRAAFRVGGGHDLRGLWSGGRGRHLSRVPASAPRSGLAEANQRPGPPFEGAL